jgi:hypothetical protein
MATERIKFLDFDFGDRQKMVQWKRTRHRHRRHYRRNRHAESITLDRENGDQLKPQSSVISAPDGQWQWKSLSH